MSVSCHMQFGVFINNKSTETNILFQPNSRGGSPLHDGSQRDGFQPLFKAGNSSLRHSSSQDISEGEDIIVDDDDATSIRDKMMPQGLLRSREMLTSKAPLKLKLSCKY